MNKIVRLPDAIRHAFRNATSCKMVLVLVDIPCCPLPGAEVDFVA